MSCRWFGTFIWTLISLHTSKMESPDIRSNFRCSNDRIRLLRTWCSVCLEYTNFSNKLVALGTIPMLINRKFSSTNFCLFCSEATYSFGYLFRPWTCTSLSQSPFVLNYTNLLRHWSIVLTITSPKCFIYIEIWVYRLQISRKQKPNTTAIFCCIRMFCLILNFILLYFWWNFVRWKYRFVLKLMEYQKFRKNRFDKSNF